MNSIRTREALILLLGDLAVLFVSLYLTITVRYNALPSQDLLWAHLAPFSFLFLVSIILNFIVGLYEKHTRILKRKIPLLLTQVQIANTLISIVFFYLVPYFSISPKFFLFMYLIISVVFMVAWRMFVTESFSNKRKNKALLIAHGNEIKELYEEVQHNPRYGTIFVEWIDTSSGDLDSSHIVNLVKTKEINLVVADFSNTKVNGIMPMLYNHIFSGVQFADAQKMYEEIFDRVPLSLVNDNWFLENVSSASKFSFDLFKRLMDIITSVVFGSISLIFYPFIYFAIKLDDGGVIFSYQDRVGQNNKVIRIVKFRTMTVANDEGKWGSGKNVVTRVGNFLRKSRLDELPQFWNVFRGDISLVGPRPEFFIPVASYSEKVPYYNIRHIVKPGLFGWAQIQHQKHPHHGLDVAETKNKLSYDLYYIKNRSMILEIKIIFQTLKILVSFVGR